MKPRSSKGKRDKSRGRDKKDTGERESGLPEEGEGKFVFPDGSTYEGAFKHVEGAPVRHGAGRYEELISVAPRNSTTPTSSVSAEPVAGQVFDGTWDADAFVEGTITFPDGASYTGRVSADGAYQSGGTYTWRDGSSYTGEWDGTAMHGAGAFTDAAGRVWRGAFTANYGPGLWTHEGEPR